MQYLRKKLRNLDHYAKKMSINLLMTDLYQMNTQISVL